MNRLSKGRYLGTIGGLVLLIGVVVFLSPGVGSRSGEVGLARAWGAFMRDSEARSEAERTAYMIGFRLRMPRTLLAIEVGMSLSLCGAVFQALFRNPLATPYTLGISSGGALGALVAIKLGLEAAVLGISAISISAFGGAMLVVGVIFLFTRGTRRLTMNELLLAGVTMGLFCSAMMMLVTCLFGVRETFESVRWMMGTLVTIGNFTSATILPLMLPSWVVFIAWSRAFNQYQLGDELAASRGLNVRRFQAVCIVLASLAVAGVVSMCGPIGFVGLVVPHLTALLVGRDHRILLPASALAGGVFLAVCDWISQLVMVWVGWLSGTEASLTVLPIGVVTAVVGVPIFLVLLHRRAT